MKRTISVLLAVIIFGLGIFFTLVFVRQTPAALPSSSASLEDHVVELEEQLNNLEGKLADFTLSSSTPMSSPISNGSLQHRVTNLEQTVEELEEGLILLNSTFDEKLSCWDRNQNTVQDPEEDINSDGFYNILDCQSIDCWDVNFNGFADPQEDTNGDGSIDYCDCPSYCWDFNCDGVEDPAEDLNGDGEFNTLDCSPFD